MNYATVVYSEVSWCSLMQLMNYNAKNGDGQLHSV